MATKRLRVLSSQLTTEGTAGVASGGFLDDKYFHYIGEMSPVTEQFIAPPKGTKGGGSNTNQRMLETRKNPTNPGFLKTSDHMSMLLSDGTPRDLMGTYASNIGLAARYGAPGDDSLFEHVRPAKEQGAIPIPSGKIGEIVNMLETVPFRDVNQVIAEGLRDNKWTHQEGLAAAQIAVNRNTEHVGDHHGGPIHPVSGGFAAAWMAEMIGKSGDKNGQSAKQWADLAIAQQMSIATRHLETSRKLAGPAVMPKLDLGEKIRAMTDPKQVCNELKEAVLKSYPNRAEKLLVRALELKAKRGDILAAIMEEGVPRNVVDDHYFLYPNFAFLTCDAIGWEHAEYVLRSAVRYVTTVSPHAKDLIGTEGYRFHNTQGIGGKSDYQRVQDIAEKYGLLKEGAVPLIPKDPVAEQAWANQLALDIAENIPEVEGMKLSDVYFNRTAEKMGEAMSKGMSLQGGLSALSQAACRFYLRNSVGNPMDVHFINSICARRHMWAHEEVPARLKVISLMQWASGFEISGGVRASTPREKGGLRNNLFGANRVPGHLEKLEAGSDAPPSDPEALLDYISHAICVRPEVQRSFNGKTDTTHDQQMELLFAGKVGVGNILTTNEVATKVFPAVYKYAQLPGNDVIDKFFARMAEHTAMDDYSEMHAWKHCASCYREAINAPRENAWIYMAACAKAICNHSGCGHRVYDLCSEKLTDLQNPRVPGWHRNGIPDGVYKPAEDHTELEKA